MRPRAAQARIGRRNRAGQAMVETIIALLFVLFAFLAVFQYADNLRAKLLLNYAAFRCARARTVGYNDYKLLKMVRLATMSAAGECLVTDDSGGPLATGGLRARMKTYLGCRFDGAARNVLDFDYWQNDRTPEPICRLSGNKLIVTTEQRRPQFFDVFTFFGGSQSVFSPEDDDRPTRNLHGEASIEAHYPGYLQ